MKDRKGLIQDAGDTAPVPAGNGEILKEGNDKLAQLTCEVLAETREQLPVGRTIKVPFGELSSLGAGVSSLLPQFRTVTQSIMVNTDGVLRVVNADAGDVLKVAKDGNFWGVLKTAEGKSKMAKFTSAEPLQASTTTIAAINPAAIMMAAALFSIEQKLSGIEKMTHDILGFLENEKQSEIKADIETLLKLFRQYKVNWNNEHFISSGHQQTMDIERTGQKNMIFYQERVEKLLHEKPLIIGHKVISDVSRKLLREFRYYRLSLYIYSLAGMLEVMISGNFSAENISEMKTELENAAYKYRSLYTESSKYLERLNSDAFDTGIIKEIGDLSNKAGKFIGKIPVVKEGLVDEFLQDSGKKIKRAGISIEQKTITEFAGMSDPKTSAFTDTLSTLIRIYDETSEIWIDRKNIYLITADAGNIRKKRKTSTKCVTKGVRHV